MEVPSSSLCDDGDPAARTRGGISLWSVLSALFLFAGSLVLTTRDNRFPFTYHPDESSKVKQVLGHKRNFNHPLLLLSGTEALMRLRPAAQSRQDVAVIGRTFAALCAAGVVAAFTLLAASRHGILAGWIAGVLTALHPQLFELAHYMKEDPVLMFGLALTFLAMELFRRGATTGRVVFLGIAAATAASGKFMGVIALLMVLPLVYCSTPERGARRRHLLLLAGAFFGAFLLFNYSVLKHPSGMFEGIRRGSAQAASGHTGLTRSVPHLAYLPVLLLELAAPILAFALFHLAHLAIFWRRAPAVDWLVGLFPVGYLLMLSLSPEVSPRYLLPVTTGACLLAAFGVVEGAKLCARLAPSRAQGTLAAVLSVAGFGVVLGAAVPQFRARFHDYASDDHLELESWVRSHVPAGAVIAQDGRVGLPKPDDAKSGDGRPMAQVIRTEDFVADLGPLAKLRADGVTYVGVCYTTYGRFLDSAQVPSAATRATYERRKEFYHALFEAGEPVWESAPGRVLYLHPGLKLFKLDRK